WTVVLGSSMLVIVGLTRAGTRIFWKPAPPAAADAAPRRLTPRQLRLPETAATVLLLGYGVALAVAPGALVDYTRAAAAQLLAPEAYIEQMRAALPERRTP